MHLRSLRAKLSLIYVTFSLISMICLGIFSYWYLDGVLESSRQQTMERREERILRFINTWPKHDNGLTLNEKLLQISKAVAETDSLQLYALDGKLLYSSPGPEEYKVEWPNDSCLERCYSVVHKSGHVIRTLNHVVVMEGQRLRLSISGITEEHFEVLNTIRNSYFFFCPFLLAFSVVGGLMFSHRALEPVRLMTRKARTLGIQNLTDRLPIPPTGDELQLLAESWNGLLERLAVAVNRLTEFTSDVSHDLRTTITVMLTTAEFALRRQRTEAEYRSALTAIAAECSQTARLLDDLLAASRSDIVQQNIEWSAIHFCLQAAEVCDAMRSKADLKKQTLACHLCQEVNMIGDLSMVRRLITILLDNAIKYTPEYGAIHLSVERDDTIVRLQVADTGIGIPEAAQSRIFDRFYRVDSSRNRDDGSTGLGLAIAKWIVEAHSAAITLESVVGKGSTFTVAFPIKSHVPAYISAEVEVVAR